MVFEYSPIEKNISGVMERLEGIARPLVGLRSKWNEYWWSFPMVSVYLAIDNTLDGKEGWCNNFAFNRVHDDQFTARL